MGMLMHHTWLEQQKKKESPVKAVHTPAPAAEIKEEPVKEQPMKRMGGRRKTK